MVLDKGKEFQDESDLNDNSNLTNTTENLHHSTPPSVEDACRKSVVAKLNELPFGSMIADGSIFFMQGVVWIISFVIMAIIIILVIIISNLFHH